VSGRLTVHLVHPGNPRSTDPDGIVSVQRNFIRAAPEDLEFVYWGVGRPGAGETEETEGTDGTDGIHFEPVVSSIKQRPRIPLSLKFAVGSLRTRERIRRGILRFDRVESALPFLGSPLAKVLFLHVWDLDDVVGLHSDSRWRRLGRLYGRVLDAVVPRMDRVYVLRQEVGRRLAGRLPEVAQRVRPFGVPVDVSRFSPLDAAARRAARAELSRQLAIPRDARIVAFAGRLEAVKQPEAVAAVSQVMTDDPRPVHFVIAGTGSLRRDMERTAGTASPRRMHFMGPVSQERLASILSAADACFLPSGFEAIPNVVLESLACGTPVVASTSSGGVADLLAGQGVGKVALNSPEGFAAALREMFAWEGGRARACREAAMPFAPDAVNRDLYQDVRVMTGATVTPG
jgi:glycosyltransferase involved in cell wall biosynthesis